MGINIPPKPVISLCLIFVLSRFVYQYFFKRDKKIPSDIHEVLMFYHGDVELQKSKYSKCVITANMDRLLNHLNSAQQSLDVCMYVFTNIDIGNILLRLNLKGVRIRIIVDADMAYTSGSVVKKLERKGIPVRWMKSTNIMHHKFCLIDAESEDQYILPIVIMGSLNWTNQALNGNWEDVAITSQKDLVRQYKSEFERLWGLFKPIVDYNI